MNAILQALFTLVPFSTDLLNVTDRLQADNNLSSPSNQRSVCITMMMNIHDYDDGEYE